MIVMSEGPVLPGVDTEAQTTEQTMLAPLFRLILFDDDDHTYEYVIAMMMKLFGKTDEEAYQVAYEVDHLGEATVKTCALEEAVAGRNAIHNFGADPLLSRSKGSMSAAVIEVTE